VAGVARSILVGDTFGTGHRIAVQRTRYAHQATIFRAVLDCSGRRVDCRRANVPRTPFVNNHEVGYAPTPMDQSGRLRRFEERATWPMAAAAVTFLVGYTVQVIVQPHGSWSTATNFVMSVAWGTFVLDYAARLCLASDRPRFFRHLLDLAVVALPLFRPLRLFRLLFLIAVIDKAIGQAIRGRVVLYTASGAVLLIYACSLSILQVGRARPGASIRNFGDALWWSLETVTTVGYGDKAPHTTLGKLIAATLMIGGIGVVSLITASLASWIVERVEEEDTANQAITETHINALRTDVEQQVDSLRAEIQRLADALREQRTPQGRPSVVGDPTKTPPVV
jgi:voltage-gated potassium channel